MTDREYDEFLADTISLLFKHFKCVLKKFEKRTDNSSAKNKPGASFPSKQFKNSNKKGEVDKSRASRV